MDTQTNTRPGREVITNLRHAGTKKVFRVTWSPKYGTTAAEAGVILAGMKNPDVVGDIAKALGVSREEISLSVAKRSELREGSVTLASDAKAAKAAKATTAKASTLTPDEQARQWALAYVMEHPNTTFAVALKRGHAHVASEALRSQLAELDARIAELDAQTKALVSERATLTATLRKAK